MTPLTHPFHLGVVARSHEVRLQQQQQSETEILDYYKVAPPVQE